MLCNCGLQRAAARRHGRRFGGRIRAVGMGLVLTVHPAVAQTGDQFRSAPIVAPAPPPRPHRQPRAAPEFDLPAPSAAVAPAPSLPPTGVIWARVRQVAQTSGIGVPLASDPPFDASTASPEARALVGAWGPGIWQGGGAIDDRLILVVLSVDGGTSVRGVVARGTGTGWSLYNAPMSGGRFSVHIQTSYEASGRFSSTRSLEDEDWQFQLRSDGTLYGTRRGPSVIVLPRLQ